MVNATCSVNVRVNDRVSCHSQLISFDLDAIPALPSVGDRFFLRGFFSTPVTNILWMVDEKGKVVGLMVELDPIKTDDLGILEELKDAGFKEDDHKYL